jgi:hypothetical protein
MSDEEGDIVYPAVVGFDPVSDWPNCEVADCPNKSCLRLGSAKCWPHTVGAPFDTSKLTKKQQREYERRWRNSRALLAEKRSAQNW